MFEAVLTGKLPQCWVADVAAKYPANVKIMDVKPLEKEEGVQELFEIYAKPEFSESIVQELRKNGHVNDVELIRSKNGRIYGSATVRGRPACMAFIESKCFLISATSTPQSQVEWRVRGAGDSLRDLVRKLEKDGLQMEVKRISKPDETKPLTPHQAWTLEKAFEKGYYDFPRRTNLQRFAKEVGVKPATLSEVLRSAEKKAIREYLWNQRGAA